MKNKLFILLIIVCLMLTGCSKDKITSEEFDAAFENSDCEIVNSTEEYENTDGINEMHKAECGDYDIEFYILSSEDYAKEVYDTNITKFKAEKTGTNLEKEYTESNYNIYSLTCGGKFRYISRIDNTLVYVYTDDTYKKDASKYIDVLGY